MYFVYSVNDINVPLLYLWRVKRSVTLLYIRAKSTLIDDLRLN